MLPRIGFSLQKQYDRPHTQIIPLLQKFGFSAVSPIWSNDIDMSSLADCAARHSVELQSLHAPHRGIALLWEPDSEGAEEVFENILKSLDDCVRFEIPILVMHGWSGLYYTFPEAPLDFRLFDRIVRYAEERGISIAFENLEGEEYLAALMSRYVSCKNVGYCWDSGHDNCYPHKTDFLKEYGDRLIMTHINDNLGLRREDGIPMGEDDLHFIPFDGTVDWDSAIGRLNRAPRQRTLNFELKTSSHSTATEDLIYSGVSLEDFIAKAGMRAQKIAEKYAQGVAMNQ